MRISTDKHTAVARELLTELSVQTGQPLADSILNATQVLESEVIDQRKRVAELKQKLSTIDGDRARQLLSVSDNLVNRSVWLVGR
jgi:pyruvate-ferredoxin/flavodoxin oxidoreductase